jgi:succinate-semialdehyde dehydrogenase/glutarate-semialdehyde dehydrogenase
MGGGKSAPNLRIPQRFFEKTHQFLGSIMKITVVNPATGDQLREYEAHRPSDLERMVKQAEEAFSTWSVRPFEDRSEVLRVAAAILEENQAKYARLISEEMGKVFREAKAEIDKCAWVCRYYAEHGAAFLAEEHIATDAAKSYVTFPPLGVLLAVMPWNFPFWQVFRFAAPALMAGNTALLKHASNVPGCALAIETIFRQAGLPEGGFAHARVDNEQVAALIDHPLVRGVALTGSERAGAAAAQRAGLRVKKTVLELGGSDAYLILEDADLTMAAETCAASRLLNAGQSCIGAKRFIVHQAVYVDFLELFVAKMKAARFGDPFDERVDIGPLARHDLREQLHQQVSRSVAAGAILRLGGYIPEGKGAYYPPTVLSEVRPGMPAFEEELFGPAAAVVLARDEQEAVALANASDFGLGAAVFTRDARRGERIAARELAVGSCFVNAMVKSDPRLPFGGIKNSGYGRELSHYGIKEFTNIKTVWIR